MSGIDPAAGSEAFQALGHEARLAVLRTLAERGATDPSSAVSFTALFEATDVETSAGFAYHLRQIEDAYVRETDDGYVLTGAGRAVVRALAAGALTSDGGLDAVELEEACPYCDGGSLVATGRPPDVVVRCGRCDRTVLSLPAGPGRTGERPPEEALSSLEGHHRVRIPALREGTCPECGGDVEYDFDATTDDEGPVRVSPRCGRCGYGVATPVAAALRDHPDVVSFYRDHGVDLRERPLWRVGTEWRERLLAEDPPRIAVTSAIEGDRLELLLDEDLTVEETRRSAS